MENLANALDVEHLDFSALERDDLANLILQRSEILYDQPNSGRIVRAWTKGDPGPLFRCVNALGTQIALRVALAIQREYDALKPQLGGFAGRIADIGCGYAFFDLFLAHDTSADILLIDQETNDERHFGFTQNASAYSSLDKAARS